MENLVIRCIKMRRSIREYEDKKVPKDIIEKIIEAGKYAPSAENRQPWKFVVITNKNFIKKLSEEIKREIGKMLKSKFKKRRYRLNPSQIRFFHVVATSSKDLIFYNAPVVIFIITTDEIFNDESCACCAQNMMLAAASLDIGSCWIGFAKVLERNKKMMEEIGIPDGYHIAACLIFGYAAHKPKAAIRKPTADIIKWIE